MKKRAGNVLKRGRKRTFEEALAEDFEEIKEYLGGSKKRKIREKGRMHGWKKNYQIVRPLPLPSLPS